MQSPGACKDQNVISNVQKVAFYRKFDQRLELYDNAINLLFSAIFKPIGNTATPTTVSASIAATANNMATFSPAGGFAAGKYFLLLLFNRSLGRIQGMVTSNTITFQLCSQMVFNYSLLDGEKISIKSESVVAKDCQKGNEKLYVSYL